MTNTKFDIIRKIMNDKKEHEPTLRELLLQLGESIRTLRDLIWDDMIYPIIIVFLNALQNLINKKGSPPTPRK